MVFWPRLCLTWDGGLCSYLPVWQPLPLPLHPLPWPGHVDLFLVATLLPCPTSKDIFPVNSSPPGPLFFFARFVPFPCCSLQRFLTFPLLSSNGLGESARGSSLPPKPFIIQDNLPNWQDSCWWSMTLKRGSLSLEGVRYWLILLTE